MSADKTVRFDKKHFPAEGVQISVSEGNALTRIHLDLSREGVTLATAGAANALLTKGNRQVVSLNPTKDGISLALVGAASAVRK